MPEIDDLPHVIAALNAVSVIFLAAGYGFIRAGQWRRHRACMLAALAASAGFLLVYLAYKYNSGFARFGGAGAVRVVYFSILAVHVLGAMTLLPMVPMTVIRALKQNYAAHRRLARWTWPLWMGVGVTGIVVYVFAIHLYPHA